MTSASSDIVLSVLNSVSGNILLCCVDGKVKRLAICQLGVDEGKLTAVAPKYVKLTF